MTSSAPSQWSTGLRPKLKAACQSIPVPKVDEESKGVPSWLAQMNPRTGLPSVTTVGAASIVPPNLVVSRGSPSAKVRAPVTLTGR